MAVIPNQKVDNQQQQADNLVFSVSRFIRCIVTLPAFLFLEKIDGWTPRDITAHLIGWNRYTIEGNRQLIKGENPFYLIDPGDDFNKFNSILVQEYASQDRDQLIEQLETSSKELKQFVLSLTPGEWNTDFGVRWKGGAVTVKNSVDALIGDYDTHKIQIEEWVKIRIPGDPK